MSPAFRATESGALLYLRVTPKARRDEIAGVERLADGEERLALRVAAPPDKGRANRAVAALLARALALPKSRIEITAGETGRLKTARIAGDPADIAARLGALLSKQAKDGA